MSDCPECNEPGDDGSLCRDCDIQAAMASMACEECGFTQLNATATKLLGWPSMVHADDCSRRCLYPCPKCGGGNVGVAEFITEARGPSAYCECRGCAHEWVALRARVAA